MCVCEVEVKHRLKEARKCECSNRAAPNKGYLYRYVNHECVRYTSTISTPRIVSVILCVRVCAMSSGVEAMTRKHNYIYDMDKGRSVGVMLLLLLYDTEAFVGDPLCLVER